ncbi:unnamed protein product [Ectocarpus sp. CCAP 1310/34]|nr:unnamed protein product [Ectocarpus sp. CCAP 1310/34]
MAAALMRPGMPAAMDINDLHVSLGYAHERLIREAARQMKIKVTGPLSFSDGCAVGKGIRKAISTTTSSTASRPLQRLFADLTGPLPPSAGGTTYCLALVDDNQLRIVKFIPNKQTTTVTNALREMFVSVHPLRDVHGDFQFLLTDNGTELVNASVSDLFLEFGITRELTSPDGGQKRNGKVERRIGLVREGGRAVVTEASLLFPDLQFPRVACDYNRIWSEAWGWMSSCINTRPRLDKPPDHPPRQRSSASTSALHHAGYSPRPHPAKIAPKGERCFYVNPGDYHSCDCSKVLFAFGAVGYTTGAVWGYRRRPFVGLLPTYNGGAICTGRGDGPGGGGDGGDFSRRGDGNGGFSECPVAGPSTASARAPSPAPMAAGATAAGMAAATPRAAFAGAVEHTRGGSVFPPLSVLPPAPAPPPSPVPPLAPHLQRQHDRYHVTPAVTRAPARQAVAGGAARGLPGALALLSMEEDIAASLAAHPLQDELPLPNGPARDLETPATYARAHAGQHSAIWGAAEKRGMDGLVGSGTLEPAEGL